VEHIAVGSGAVGVDGRVFLAPAAGTFASVWFQLRLLQ